MSKRAKRIASHPGQLSLFDLLKREVPVSQREQGRMRVRDELRECIIDCIRGCDLSRWEIAGQMSNLLDQEITIHQINAWTAESKEGHRFPAEYLPAFCEAVGCHDPMKLLAEKAGMFLIPGDDALRVEKAREMESMKRSKDRIRRIDAILEASS